MYGIVGITCVIWQVKYIGIECVVKQVQFCKYIIIGIKQYVQYYRNSRVGITVWGITCSKLQQEFIVKMCAPSVIKCTCKRSKIRFWHSWQSLLPTLKDRGSNLAIITFKKPYVCCRSNCLKDENKEKESRNGPNILSGKSP